MNERQEVLLLETLCMLTEEIRELRLTVERQTDQLSNAILVAAGRKD